MLKCNLRIIMATNKVDSIREMMRITGLTRKPLDNLWHEQDITSIKLETLIKICNALQCKLSDLIEYIPE